MELHGFFKIAILIFALVIPIIVVLLAYRLVFSGLRSISSAEQPAGQGKDTASTEQAQNQQPGGPETG